MTVTDAIQKLLANATKLKASSGGNESAAFEEDARQAEFLSLPITLVILVAAFGALVAAGLPLLLGLTAEPQSFQEASCALPRRLRKDLRTIAVGVPVAAVSAFATRRRA